tara:strand:+ start:239 stop:508 length:270 start_codon:yes stop_codon:yes gene_type:complete
MYTELNEKDFAVILDVLNVYDPNDIQHVYPEMGKKEFIDDVQDAWNKVLKIVALSKLELRPPPSLTTDSKVLAKLQENTTSFVSKTRNL